MSDQTPAQIAYAAYGATTGGLNYRGEPMPAWEQLGETIQAAWTAAAAAILFGTDHRTQAQHHLDCAAAFDAGTEDERYHTSTASIHASLYGADVQRAQVRAAERVADLQVEWLAEMPKLEAAQVSQQNAGSPS